MHGTGVGPGPIASKRCCARPVRPTPVVHPSTQRREPQHRCGVSLGERFVNPLPCKIHLGILPRSQLQHRRQIDRLLERGVIPARRKMLRYDRLQIGYRTQLEADTGGYDRPPLLGRWGGGIQRGCYGYLVGATRRRRILHCRLCDIDGSGRQPGIASAGKSLAHNSLPAFCQRHCRPMIRRTR